MHAYRTVTTKREACLRDIPLSTVVDADVHRQSCERLCVLLDLGNFRQQLRRDPILWMPVKETPQQSEQRIFLPWNRSRISLLFVLGSKLLINASQKVLKRLIKSLTYP